MCDFCTKHGDGKIWYKNAKNYANDLMADMRRRDYIHSFLDSTIGDGIASLGRLETIFKKKKKLPARLVTAMVEKAKDEHYGQVVPIEDVREIVNKAATVARMPCACRWAADKKEVRCCYAVSYTPEIWHKNLDMSYFGSIGDDGFETLSQRDAIVQMEDLEQAGAVHTIWTMVTPFIGAICNCTQKECLGLRTLSMHVQTLAKGEYIAAVDTSLCTGCGLCEETCQFHAISDQMVDGGETVARVDRNKCYGCGLCRSTCQEGAINLEQV